MKKLIKTIFAGGFALSCSVVAVTNVSCGKNNSPTIKTTFDDFKSSAEAELIVNIVAQSHPNGWDSLPDSDLTKGDFRIVGQTVVVKITSRSKIESAVFTATYTTNTIYDINAWGCSTAPAEIASWTKFKTVSENESAANIVAQTKPEGWDLLPKNDLKNLTKSDFQVVGQTVVVSIISKSKAETAVFAITYNMTNTTYNVGSWICTKKPTEPILWTRFKTVCDNDANNVIVSHPSFGVTDYWGIGGISAPDDAKLVDNLIKNIFNNVDEKGNFKVAVHGAFEEPLDSDINNTIAMVFLTAKKGDSWTNIYNNSKIIFNSWNNKSYDTQNWGDHDISPNYSINKFYDSLKTDQTKLLSIFGGAQTDKNHLMHSKATKLTVNNLTGNSHLIWPNESLNNNLSFDDKNIVPITTTYTLSMTASDDTSNIVNIKSHFSFKKGNTIPTSKNITASTFSDTTTTSALSPTDVKNELSNFLAMNDIADKSTFREAWKSQITYLDSSSSQKKLLNAKSITIGDISDTGEISIAVVDSNGKTINLTTTATISNGFSGINNTNETYARFIKANYGFSDQNKWDFDQNLANTMLSIFKLKLAS